MRLLEVGDVIYLVTGFGISKLKIGRVTAKFAFTENEIKLKREVSEDGRIQRAERIKWDMTNIYLASTELTEKYMQQNYSSFLSRKVDWKLVPLEVKKQVYELVKDYKKED